ncbi:hypothetical protein ACFSHP_12150 [Novosphingobium panipatense]
MLVDLDDFEGVEVRFFDGHDVRLGHICIPSGVQSAELAGVSLESGRVVDDV